MAEAKADKRDRDEAQGPDRPVHSCGLDSGFDLKGDGKFWERFLRRGGVDLVSLENAPQQRCGGQGETGSPGRSGYNNPGGRW